MNKPALNIVYLSPYFWPETIGSAPYCTQVAEWLAAAGHKVHVVAFRPHYPSPELFTAWADGSRDEERHGDLLISRLPAQGRGEGKIGPRLLNDLSFLVRASAMALRGRFADTDVVVAYVPSALTLFVATLISRLTGARVIGVVHDVESGLAGALRIAQLRLLLAAIRLMERLAFNSADQLIVLSDAMGDEMRKLGCRRPISTLPIWAEVPDAPPPPQGTPVVMYSGNFGKKQNLEQLLPLIEALDSEAPDVKVVLRGEGSERTRMEERVRDIGADNTIFLPLAPPDALFKTLQEAHVHLAPQALNVANYALPSKLFNIMAAGRPFICIAAMDSPLAHLAERSGAGVCVESGRPVELLKAVLALARDPERIRQMGERGRAFVRENMDRDHVLGQYESIITASQPAGA